jgi:hypothetical protein
MITGTVIKNGVIKIILTGSDDIDIAILKTLNGATCTVIADNFRLGDKSIAGGLIIQASVDTKQEVVTNAAGDS